MHALPLAVVFLLGWLIAAQFRERARQTARLPGIALLGLLVAIAATGIMSQQNGESIMSCELLDEARSPFLD